MKIMINETQKRLITESINDRIKNIQEESVNITKQVIESTATQTGINLSMLLTWGASIGGFISPVIQWLQGKNPELSDMDISLIMTAVIAVIFYDNKKVIIDLVSEIKKRGLEDYFKNSLKKSIDLKNTLVNFLKSLNISSFNLLSMLSYAFLVPLLQIFYNMAHEGHFNSHDAEMIAKAVASFGLITVGSNYLKVLIEKILNRFSSKK